MKRSKSEKDARMVSLTIHMISGGKVMVKDKADNTIKHSTISAIYADYKVTLPDCIHSEYGIFELTFIKPL